MSSSDSDLVIQDLLYGGNEKDDKTSSDDEIDGQPKAKRRRYRKIKDDKEKKKIPIKHETVSEREERIREMITHMMFAAGDGPLPDKRNIAMVINMVHDQLTKILCKAHERIKCKGIAQMECVDIIFEMRSRPDIISRLLKLAKAAANVRSLGSDVSSQVPSIDAGSGGESSEDDNVDATTSSLNLVSHYDRLVESVNRAKIGKKASEIEDMDDIVGRRRALRLASRAFLMDADMYEKFVDARGSTLCTFNTRYMIRMVRESHSLRHWLGNPPVGKGVMFIVNFIAKETINQIVDFASRIAGEVARNDKLNATNMKWTHISEEDRSSFIDVGTLHPSHYRSAIVRCNQMKNGDFLFGVKT